MYGLSSHFFSFDSVLFRAEDSKVSEVHLSVCFHCSPVT